MSKKTIAVLVAMTTIHGGMTIKGEFKPASAEPGDELTKDKLAALGIDAAELEGLKARGVVGDANARVAEGPATADDKALAAAIKRAEDAEALVKERDATIAELTEQLAEATKPA